MTRSRMVTLDGRVSMNTAASAMSSEHSPERSATFLSMFKGRRFDQSVILLCVRRYLAY